MPDQNVNETVTVALEYYEQLVVAFEHLSNIEELAFNHAELDWRNELRFDLDAVGEYIKAIRTWRAGKKLEELKAEKESKENDAV